MPPNDPKRRFHLSDLADGQPACRLRLGMVGEPRLSKCWEIVAGALSFNVSAQGGERQ
jgi:hypothetical protein